MAVNIVKYRNSTLIDLTPTTATASDVASGKVFFDKSGTQTTGTASGGGSASVDTKTVTNSSNTATSLAFTSMKGEPIAFVLRATSQISSSGSTTYYYVTAVRYNGTNTNGNFFRIGSTRRIQNDTTHYSFSYSGTTLTISSSGSRTTEGGSFYNGTYELVYVY